MDSGRIAGRGRRRIRSWIPLLFTAATAAAGCSNCLQSTWVDYAFVDSSPAWSPDGATVAYYRAYASQDGPPGIYVIPAVGGTARFVTGSPFGYVELRFSPDSRRLAAVSRGEVFLIDVATGRADQVTFTDNA